VSMWVCLSVCVSVSQCGSLSLSLSVCGSPSLYVYVSMCVCVSVCGDGRGHVGANKTFSKLNITPAKPKTLMSSAASESRDKVELKVKKLGLPWWSSGYKSEGSPPLVGELRSHMSQGN